MNADPVRGRFGIPFPGIVSLAFAAPFHLLTASLQMVNFDPVHPDGFVISQASQLVVQ